MAKNTVSRSQAKMVKFGYGQVEKNHLSAPQNGQVYAQLPAAADIEVLEQGQFVRYSYANGVCDFDGPGPWMMVENEIKLYDDRETDADFAMLKDNYTAYLYSALPENMPEGTNMVPRVLKMSIGDIWTTNTINNDITELTKGDKLMLNAKGILEKGEAAGGEDAPIFQVVKVYSMPDMQPGCKVQRIG